MRLLVTGSADGLGRAAADSLLANGHDIVVHARNQDRAAGLAPLVNRGADIAGADWQGKAPGSYADSKLFVTTLAAAVARLHPQLISNAVDPGWVPTKMGGPDAPDDFGLGHQTQEWLATSDQPQALTSGGYWYHQQRQQPHASVNSRAFQDQLLQALAEETGTAL
ncbi:MAG: short-chain dehydrogenase [Arthrobacter sp.]|nr:short-chain dehydrogenase [Arthrobacter sp.]